MGSYRRRALARRALARRRCLSRGISSTFEALDITLCVVALWPDGREALLRDGSVVDALQAVRDQGLSDQSKEIAANALLSLSDEPPPVPSAEEGEHIMMSYQWDVQPAIKRLVANLQLRGYSVWLDIEQVRTLSAESEEL